MRHIEKEIDKLIYEEYGDVLDARDKEIEEKDKQLETKNKEINELNKSKKEYKNKVKELNELEDLNSPKAKEIIKSMMLL